MLVTRKGTDRLEHLDPIILRVDFESVCDLLAFNTGDLIDKLDGVYSVSFPTEAEICEMNIDASAILSNSENSLYVKMRDVFSEGIGYVKDLQGYKGHEIFSLG
jgi:hypothetical protein